MGDVAGAAESAPYSMRKPPRAATERRMVSHCTLSSAEPTALRRWQKDVVFHVEDARGVVGAFQGRCRAGRNHSVSPRSMVPWVMPRTSEVFWRRVAPRTAGQVAFGHLAGKVFAVRFM